MTRRTLFFLGIPGLAGCSGRRRLRLNVFNWSNYIADDTLPRFETETGIRVRYAIYESNEEMLARVLTGNSGWDIVFPSHYYIQPMRDLGLLQRLDLARLPNVKHFDTMFQAPPWDARHEWSLPYMWGGCGIAYSPNVQPEPRRWRDLWDPRWKGKVTMLDDPNEVFGAALKMLGASVNSTSEAELRSAQQLALQQKPLLQAYLNAEVRDQLVAGDVWAAQMWGTIAQQAIDAAPHLNFCYPEEGFSLYADNAAILKESRRAELAHQFLDYLLRPQVNADVVKAVRSATANRSARELLPPALANLETLYPHEETLKRGEWFAPLPAATLRLRDRLWTEIKASG